LWGPLFQFFFYFLVSKKKHTEPTIIVRVISDEQIGAAFFGVRVSAIILVAGIQLLAAFL
jgi:hypothetical protein